MTAASVLGVPITAPLASACRELLAGVASRGAWAELDAIARAAEDIDRQPPRGPEGAILTKTPVTIHALARCALGTACARCGAAIEEPDHSPIPWAAMVAAMKAGDATRAEAIFRDLPIGIAGEELDDGWCCSACVARQRQQEAFRRRAAMWLRRGNQLGLFGVEPARARRRRR